MKFKVLINTCLIVLTLIACVDSSLGKNQSEKFTNSIGMEMISIKAGEFRMGNEGEVEYDGIVPEARHAPYRGKGAEHPYLKKGPLMSSNALEWDEIPEHKVEITQDFYIATTPVTNAQFEQFRPEHHNMRGKRGFSTKDDEAVLYVSWEDAVAFTKWLSKKEGREYRLPTEAEWEYAVRAGTYTPYYTGKTLPEEFHQHQVMNRRHTIEPDKVNLEVGTTPANGFGLHDVHGLVEEWTLDWYGPYTTKSSKIDPVGRADGIVKVTRGGSHSTGLPFLRSANRSGALPETRHFLIGFRVVIGEMPDSKPLPKPESFRWAKNVIQEDYNWDPSEVSSDKPIFNKPRTFTKIPKHANGPLYYTHNHNPALTALPNGDLLAIWFTTVKERGREMLVAGSRLRRGNEQWDDADIFFHVPDRNQTGQALWWDGNKKIYHFSGVGIGDHWRDLSLVMRTSVDNGVTWSRPKIISSEYGSRNQVVDSVIGTSDGSIILVCDARPSANGGSVIHISKDGGENWTDPGKDKPTPDFSDGKKGAWIAGIHATIAELNDGRLLAFGRGDDINGKMPKSISQDGGKTWEYHASDFDPIGGAQRATMIRLNEGPLLLVSFSTSLEQENASGRAYEGSGMFAAISYDDGKTWPTRKLVTPGDKCMILRAPCNYRWGNEYSILDHDRAESRGYLTATQSPDGMIHILSSGTHYSFNLAWLLKPF